MLSLKRLWCLANLIDRYLLNVIVTSNSLGIIHYLFQECKCLIDRKGHPEFCGSKNFWLFDTLN